MKYLFTSLLILINCMWLYGQKSSPQIMNWRTAPAGSSPAQESEYFRVDKGKILCYLSNDKDFLFVDMIIKDPAVQKKVLDVGMNIWIDVTGKDKKALSVRYPMGANIVRSQLARKGNRMTEDEIRLMTVNSPTAMAYEVLYNGVGEKKTRVVRATTDTGCNGRIYYNDDGDLIYFVLFPMKDIVFEQAKGKAVPFSLGIEYGADPSPAGNIQAGAGAPGAAGRPSVPGAGGPQGPQSAVSVIWIKGLTPSAAK